MDSPSSRRLSRSLTSRTTSDATRHYSILSTPTHSRHETITRRPKLCRCLYHHLLRQPSSSANPNPHHRRHRQVLGTQTTTATRRLRSLLPVLKRRPLPRQSKDRQQSQRRQRVAFMTCRCHRSSWSLVWSTLKRRNLCARSRRSSHRWPIHDLQSPHLTILYTSAATFRTHRS